MADMKSLALDKKDAQRQEARWSGKAGKDSPKYPGGVSLYLDDTVTEKLGLDVTKFKIGQKVKIIAEAEIIEVSSRKNQVGTDDTMNIQLVAMDIKPKAEDDFDEGFDG